MSNDFIEIEGGSIRSRLRAAGLPGGKETVCCGGSIKFSKDYESQLKRLKMKGKFKVLERGVVMALIVIE